MPDFEEIKPQNNFLFSCFLRYTDKLLPLLSGLPAEEIFEDIPKNQRNLLKHCLYLYEIVLISMLKDKKIELFSLTYSIIPYYILEDRFLDGVLFNKNYLEDQRKELIMNFNLPASLFPPHEINMCHIINKDLNTLEKEIETWTKQNSRRITNS